MGEDVDRSIPFTDDHVEKIRRGEKQTTMRTIKRENFYPVGWIVPVRDTELQVKITDMAIVRYGPGTLEPADCPDEGIKKSHIHLREDERSGTTLHPGIEMERALKRLAELEGFSDAEEMLDWFQGGNPWGAEYDLPQPFFLYRIKPVHDRGEGGNR